MSTTENELDKDFISKLEESAKKYDISIPNIRATSFKKIYDYNQLIDFQEMEAINKAIEGAMIALFKVSESLGRYDRLLTKAKTVHKRAWSREYVASTQKTDNARKTEADINTEDLEDDVIVYTQAREDLKRMANDTKTLLQSLQTLSSNFRQQMNL